MDMDMDMGWAWGMGIRTRHSNGLSTSTENWRPRTHRYAGGGGTEARVNQAMRPERWLGVLCSCCQRTLCQIVMLQSTVYCVGAELQGCRPRASSNGPYSMTRPVGIEARGRRAKTGQ